jgi:serine/threonine protein kinase
MNLEPGTRLGLYEIRSALGAGGMGEVYRACDTKLDREVAIKVLPEAFARDAERVARFQREAKVLASLNHPNIAAIHGFDESDGIRFLVLELVEGETLGGARLS